MIGSHKILQGLAFFMMLPQLVCWLWQTAYFFIGFWVLVGGDCGGLVWKMDMPAFFIALHLVHGMSLPTTHYAFCYTSAPQVILQGLFGLWAVVTTLIGCVAIRKVFDAESPKRKSITRVAIAMNIPVLIVLCFALIEVSNKQQPDFWSFSGFPYRSQIIPPILCATTVTSTSTIMAGLTCCKPRAAAAFDNGYVQV